MGRLLTLILAVTLPAPDGGSQVVVSSGVSRGNWMTLPDCAADGGNALNYTASTTSFACGATQAAKALNVNTADGGNSGGGEDTLATYTLPAGTLAADGHGVYILAFGNTTNNVNSKNIKCYFGSTVILNHDMDTSKAQTWKIEARVFRTGAATQRAVAWLIHDNASNDTTVSTLSFPAETLSGTVVIKCTATGTADYDVTQHVLFVSYF